VGEGIDHFGQFCVISDNIISSTYLFGIKLIHGASFNEVLGNLIDGYGLAGIVIAGSASAATAADNNRVDGNIIFNGNFNSAWSANENACILTQTNGGDTGTLSLPRNNVFSNNSLRPANGKWAINKGVSVSTNLYLNNKMSRGVSGWVTGAEPAFVNDALPTVVKASRSAAFTVAAGATSIVVCNTESVDRRAEYNNGAGTWTCQIPGEYRFAASVRVSAISTGKDVTLTITKNGVGVSVRSVTMSATSGSVSIDDVIVCAQDDVIDLRVTNGDTATATFGADPHTFMSLVSAA
jgi:hypothetical protein